MSLVKNVESILGRTLSPEEVTNLANFQRFHNVDDDDPLIVVLALMAKSQLMLESLPNLLQQKAVETIELHQQTLREQSTLIAKELITTVAQNIEAANRLEAAKRLKEAKLDWRLRGLAYAGIFIAGAIVALALRYFW